MNSHGWNKIFDSRDIDSNDFLRGIGRMFYRRRKDLRISTYDLAQRTGIPRRLIDRIEKGQFEELSFEMSEAISRALGLEMVIELSGSGTDDLDALMRSTETLRSKCTFQHQTIFDSNDYESLRNLGAAIKARRQQLGLSIEEIARRVDLTVEELEYLEKGDFRVSTDDSNMSFHPDQIVLGPAPGSPSFDASMFNQSAGIESVN